MKLIGKKLIPILVFCALCIPEFASAQSSITLYGVIDESMLYQSSATTLGSTKGGTSNVFLSSGTWAGSRWGFKGVEDLGAGMQAVFQLENGFNQNTGASQQGGLEFGRLAYVGLSAPDYGTLTVGRQYTPYFTLLLPYSPAKWLDTHPGDLDAMDFTYHTNNSIEYVSPKFFGFTVGALYALGGIAGNFNRGSTWSAALQYAAGPLGMMAGIFRLNNAAVGGGAFSTESTTISGTQSGVSAVTNGYITAQAQQRFVLAGKYQLNSAWDVNVTYSNVQYIPGVGSLFQDTAIFNTGGAVLHWKPTSTLDLAVAYSYTRATKANGITSAAQYQQVSLTQYYSLSKRTGLYGFEAFQRANGQTLGTNGTGDVIGATPTVADFFNSSPSASRSEKAVAIGIITRF